MAREARPFAPGRFARAVAFLVVVALLLRAGAVMLLHRLDPARGYEWDSFFAALPGALAGIVLGSRSPRRPHASLAVTLAVAAAVGVAHFAIGVAMGRRTGFASPPPHGLASLALAAVVAALAVLVGAFVGRRATRVSERLGATAPPGERER